MNLTIAQESTSSTSGLARPVRALVSGGAGFIGSHLVESLLARGDEVVVVDNLSTGRIENLPDGAARGTVERLTFIEADLREAIEPLTTQDPFLEIYHLAAAVGVKRIIAKPIESIETNVLDTTALLDFASGHAQRGAPMPATLIASSSEVYGKGHKSPFSEEDDCVYGPTTALRWSYACSKALDEHLALAHHARHALPVVIARLFNTVGPRQVGEYGMVLPSFVARVLCGHGPEVYGDGMQTRCFCDVRDVVPVLPKLLSSPQCYGRVFNVGSDQSISIRDLAHLVVQTLAPDQAERLKPCYVAYDQAYAPGFEDLQQRKPDMTRLRDAIGFEPVIDLATTIADLAASLRNRSPKREHSEATTAP